jgi:glycosyltransferase involved in cell wall biosynthesis
MLGLYYMKFSLIMATYDRKDEVKIFFESLIVQTYKHFELLIIDQNEDNRVYDIYTQYKDKLDIKYFRSEKKGLSVNRNLGLNNCSGDIIAFPDDDCEYNTDTLEKAANLFLNSDKYSFYTCNTREKSGSRTVSSDNSVFYKPFKPAKTSQEISLFNIMSTGIAFTIFVRADCIRQYRFDEQLGVGTEYGSGEESDLLFYLIEKKAKGFYHADIFIYHPYKVEDINRAFSYGKGFGAVHKKAITTYKYYGLLPLFFFKLLNSVLSIIFHTHRKERIAALWGRIYGFMHYNNKTGEHT